MQNYNKIRIFLIFLYFLFINARTVLSKMIDVNGGSTCCVLFGFTALKHLSPYIKVYTGYFNKTEKFMNV